MNPSLLPIVEGHAEVEAVPVLLRRLVARFQAPQIVIARPFRVPRYKMVREGEIERALSLGSRSRRGIAAFLVLLDADDDDPIKLEQSLLSRCRKVTSLPTTVVAVERELEGWFLGCKDGLRGVRGIRPDAEAPPQPETIRGAKERLSQNMEGRRYLDVDDQPALAESMDLDLAAQRCMSFQRFLVRVESLVSAILPAP